MKLYNYLIARPIHLVILVTNLMPIVIILSRKVSSPTFRAFLFYLTVSFVINLYTDILSAHRINNILYNNIWVLFSTILSLWFFYEVFIDDKTRNSILFISVVYFLLFMFDFIRCNPDLSNLHNHKYVTFSVTLRSAIVIAFCLRFYHELIQELYIEDLMSSGVFFIVCGVFIYHCVTLFASTMFNDQFIWNSNEFMRTLVLMPLYFEILMFIISSIGLLKQKI